MLADLQNMTSEHESRNKSSAFWSLEGWSMAFWYEWEILPRNGGWIKKYLGSTNVKDGFCSPKFRGERAKKEQKKKKRLKRICVGSLQSHPQAWWFDRTHRTQKSLYSQLWLITMKDYRAKLTKGKGTRGKVQRKLGANFQEFFPSGITQDTLNSCSNKLWQRTWSVVYQGSSLLSAQGF